MIISRTPYRVSFLGGGTDYHAWYQEHGAAILATTINHYCYLTCRFLPPFFEHKSNIVWSRIEHVKTNEEIEHPAIRAVLQYLDVGQGVEIHHQGDLPARSGLGSSSAFTVGLLNAMYALRGEMSSKRALACEAVHIEREILKENVGVQDQIETAYGGFNKITIQPNGNFRVDPLILSPARFAEFHQHLLLFFTGVSRTASDIAGEKIRSIPQKKKELARMHTMVEEGIEILAGNKDICEFGALLDEAWQIKRRLAVGVAPSFVDEIYERAKENKALGGKLLGAGGGGFILFFAKPEHHHQLKQALSNLLLVPFEFEFSGSQIIFYDHQVYSQTAMVRRDFLHLQSKAQEEIIKAKRPRLEEFA